MKALSDITAFLQIETAHMLKSSEYLLHITLFEHSWSRFMQYDRPSWMHIKCSVKDESGKSPISTSLGFTCLLNTNVNCFLTGHNATTWLTNQNAVSTQFHLYPFSQIIIITLLLYYSNTCFSIHCLTLQQQIKLEIIQNNGIIWLSQINGKMMGRDEQWIHAIKSH